VPRTASSPRSSVLPLLLLALVATAAPPLPASEEPAKPRQAQGTVEGRQWTFEALGAYAFPAEVGFDDEPGIKVAVSNSGFRAEVLDRDYDREHMIDTYFRSDETLVVTFQFAKTGAYKGLSYYFASGDGCGYCYDGGVQSTVRVANGRIHGSVKSPAAADGLRFDVRFDVPIAPTDYGEPLPAGGGEPGKAYAALHGPLVAWDYAAAKPYFTDEAQAGWQEHSQEILESFRKDHPTESFRIVRGWTRDDRALLLVEGETSYSKVKTEVQMVREKGTWRLASEALQIRMGD
jgi:hypothetical protein